MNLIFYSERLPPSGGRGTISTLDTHEEQLERKHSAGDDVRKVRGIKGRLHHAFALSRHAEAAELCTFSELAGTVGPLEHEREEDSFDAGHERGDAEVDVVVCGGCSRAEESAVEEVEEDLSMR